MLHICKTLKASRLAISFERTGTRQNLVRIQFLSDGLSFGKSLNFGLASSV